MIGTTVRGAGAAVGHLAPMWRTPEGRGGRPQARARSTRRWRSPQRLL